MRKYIIIVYYGDVWEGRQGLLIYYLLFVDSRLRGNDKRGGVESGIAGWFFIVDSCLRRNDMIDLGPRQPQAGTGGRAGVFF